MIYDIQVKSVSGEGGSPYKLVGARFNRLHWPLLARPLLRV